MCLNTAILETAAEALRNAPQALNRPIDALYGYDRAIFLNRKVPVFLTSKAAVLDLLARHAEAQSARKEADKAQKRRR